MHGTLFQISKTKCICSLVRHFFIKTGRIS